MEIRKHRIDGTVDNRWVYGEYDFYINNTIIAQLRTQLIGMEYMYLYFLPTVYRDNDRTRIDIRYKTYDEALEEAKKIVIKKLYSKATMLLEEINDIKTEE